MTAVTDAARWEALFPDPTERAQWRAKFGDIMAERAAEHRAHFDDLDAAWAWASRWLMPAMHAAYLHRHGIGPSADLIRRAYQYASLECPTPETEGPRRLRASLILTHPTLTRTDRDAIITANLTLNEVDHLVTDGTFDRATICVMAGLT